LSTEAVGKRLDRDVRRRVNPANGLSDVLCRLYEGAELASHKESLP